MKSIASIFCFLFSIFTVHAQVKSKIDSLKKEIKIANGKQKAINFNKLSTSSLRRINQV